MRATTGVLGAMAIEPLDTRGRDAGNFHGWYSECTGGDGDNAPCIWALVSTSTAVSNL